MTFQLWRDDQLLVTAADSVETLKREAQQDSSKPAADQNLYRIRTSEGSIIWTGRLKGKGKRMRWWR